MLQWREHSKQIVQWLDLQPLHWCCPCFLSKWYNSHLLLQCPRNRTWQQHCHHWKNIQQTWRNLHANRSQMYGWFGFCMQQLSISYKVMQTYWFHDLGWNDVAKEASSMHQSSEWGMHAFQASFPRVKDRIALEYRGQRKVMMKLMIMLYNIRTRRVGINQILNVYMSSLEENVNRIYIN